jgi:predicted ATPase
MRSSLERLTLRGFKTIRELRDFELGRITVLIGPNGAGKSNLLSFFRMLSRALAPPGGLQIYVAEQGGASSLLYDGPAKTREIDAVLSLEGANESYEYSFRLFYTDGDAVAFGYEWYTLSRLGVKRPPTVLGAAHREPRLMSAADGGDATAGRIGSTLRRLIVHQFSDTSATSRMRAKWSVDDGSRLKEDAGNLAPFLYRLQQHQPRYYGRIVETIRLILPFFADFEFQPEFGSLLLRWREWDSDRVFSVSQAADGMLRTMALVALLQQPEEDLPDVLILDEPELGLHPYAIEVLASLLQSASRHVQVIVATQSVSLIDRFEPHDIVVVDRAGRESTFRRLDDAELAEWREQYTLSELWEKNVLGGRPAR